MIVRGVCDLPCTTVSLSVKKITSEITGGFTHCFRVSKNGSEIRLAFANVNFFVTHFEISSVRIHRQHASFVWMP